MNLFAFLTPKWWIEHDKRQMEERFEHGWNWAAGNLLRGATVEEVEQPCEEAATFECEDEFDAGVRAAVKSSEQRVRFASAWVVNAS